MDLATLIGVDEALYFWIVIQFYDVILSINSQNVGDGL